MHFQLSKNIQTNTRWIPCSSIITLSHTLDLFAEVGGIYTCDLFHDDQPTPVNTKGWKQCVSVPYSLEMNDTIAYVVNKIEPVITEKLCEKTLIGSIRKALIAGLSCVSTHNYQISCPHRIRAFEETLEYTGHSDVWITTGREIAEYYIENYYDSSREDIRRKLGEVS